MFWKVVNNERDGSTFVQEEVLADKFKDQMNELRRINSKSQKWKEIKKVLESIEKKDKTFESEEDFVQLVKIYTSEIFSREIRYAMSNHSFENINIYMMLMMRNQKKHGEKFSYLKGNPQCKTVYRGMAIEFFNDKDY